MDSFIFLIHEFDQVSSSTIVSDYCYIVIDDIHIIYINCDRCHFNNGCLQCAKLFSNDSVVVDI